MILRGSLLLIVIAVGVTSASTAPERIAVAPYDMLSLTEPSCPDPEPFGGRACFEIMDGETKVKIEIRETSPTQYTQLQIAARVSFEDYPIAFDFCDEIELMIPAASSAMSVEIQQGLRAGFCGFATWDVSPAVYGTVTSRFS